MYAVWLFIFIFIFIFLLSPFSFLFGISKVQTKLLALEKVAINEKVSMEQINGTEYILPGTILSQVTVVIASALSELNDSVVCIGSLHI